MSGKIVSKQIKKVDGILSSIRPMLTGDEKKDKHILRAISYAEKLKISLNRMIK